MENVLKVLIYSLLIILWTNFHHCENIYLDHICGNNIESSERIICSYEKPGVYLSRTVYENVQIIEFRRFVNSVLNLRTFPNIKIISISDVSEEDPCEQIQFFKSHVKIISGNTNWTCSPLAHAVTTDTATENNIELMSSSRVNLSNQTENYVESTDSTTTLTTSQTENYVESSVSATTIITSQTENYVESMTSVGVSSTSQTENYVNPTIGARTVITRQTENYVESSSSGHESETEQYKISTISLGLAAGGSFIMIVVAVLCHKFRVFRIKKIKFGQLEIEISDTNRSALSEPIMHSTARSQSSTVEPHTTLTELHEQGSSTTLSQSQELNTPTATGIIANRSMSDSAINQPRYMTRLQTRLSIC